MTRSCENPREAGPNLDNVIVQIRIFEKDKSRSRLGCIFLCSPQRVILGKGNLLKDQFCSTWDLLDSVIERVKYSTQ